jgi:bacillolysin
MVAQGLPEGNMRTRILATLLFGCVAGASAADPSKADGLRGPGQAAGELRVAAMAPAELSGWDDRLAELMASGRLRVRQVASDPLVPGRQHQRLEQVDRGVPVFGAELVRQAEGGATVSLFGTLYADSGLDLHPTLSPAEARAAAERASGGRASERAPGLFVLPRSAAGFALVYRVVVWTGADLRADFVDARSGAVLQSLDEIHSAAAVGRGRGVLDEPEKLSAESLAGGFVLRDGLRPAVLSTYDMGGNLSRTGAVLLGSAELGDSDLARDADNDWTSDPAAVDAHAYAGFVYDYYFRRYGRRGLDDANLGIGSLVHPVRRGDEDAYSRQQVGLFYTNAFYAGHGMMVYGEGGIRSAGKSWNYTAGALDIVGHELTHGVTEFSSRLVYRDESGALDEAFSDVMGTSIEFFYQPPGKGPLQADYLIGEDVVRPGGLRSLADPLAHGDPDHLSKARFLGTDTDEGGVHTNSTIASHAFFLAIEGGPNRSSGLFVRGVGAEHRDEIERVFYRAFVFLLPPRADFSMARSATLQSARDLFGSGSEPERALREAWTAVGVE